MATPHDIFRLQEALAKLVDPMDMREWFHRPNPAFDGLTPLDVVERGQIDRIWAMVHDLGSGAPG